MVSRFSKCIGFGSYLPETIYSNEILSRFCDTSDAWIQQRTGIQQRHVASPTEQSSDLAVYAIENALSYAAVDPGSIDMLICATCTPDTVLPCTAAHIQAKSALARASVFDVQNACSGFAYAFVMADLAIKQGLCQRVVVVGTEIMTRLIEWQDRNTSVLFGDGAGAVILEASETPGVLGHHLGAQSTPASIQALISHPGKAIFMDGPQVFREAIAHFAHLFTLLAQKNGFVLDQIDHFICHQANYRIVKAVAHALHLPEERFLFTGSHHANTSAASIPLALDEGVRTGRIKAGEWVALGAFGAGFTTGGSLLRL